MYHETVQVAHHVFKRATQGEDGKTTLQLPPWAILFVLLDVILFFPVYFYINYTLQQIYPTLAIVEDEDPPAYEPVALDETVVDPSVNKLNTPTNGQPKTVTSSLRSVDRLLRAHGGWRANFRGLAIYLTQAFLTSLLMIVFSGVLGPNFTPIASLLASLTMVQFSTAWVHIAISHPSALWFGKRLPPFSRTFGAVWPAVTMYWAATEFSRWLPYFIAPAVGVTLPKFAPGEVYSIPSSDQDQDVNTLVVILALFAPVAFSWIFIVIPARVILMRVQASLLPVDEDAIIPFDRSFRGTVVPAVAGGLGHATMLDAWVTFSRAAWKRLVWLYVKVFLVSLSITIMAMAVLVPEFFIIRKHSKYETHE